MVGTLVGVTFLVVGNLGDEEPSLPPAYEAFRAQPTACDGEVPEPNSAATFGAPEPQNLTGPVIALLATSCGDITVELDPGLAPQTVDSFVFLARNGFYDGTVFHRVVAGFVIQGGDPLASGFGDPGYTLPDEYPPPGFVYEPGVVAMANSGRNTTGSQFFIVAGEDASLLPPSFTVIGRVVEGMEVVETITTVPTVAQPGRTELSKPTETVYLESVTISVG